MCSLEWPWRRRRTASRSLSRASRAKRLEIFIDPFPSFTSGHVRGLVEQRTRAVRGGRNGVSGLRQARSGLVSDPLTFPVLVSPGGVGPSAIGATPRSLRGEWPCRRVSSAVHYAPR